MKKMSVVLLIVFLLVLASAPANADRTFLSTYTQKLYDSDSGMGASDALNVVQTRDGYIWTASYSGLIRYDGGSFVRYNASTSREFTARSATALYEDVNGRLWIGTNDKGLFVRENGHFSRVKNNAGPSFEAIRSIAGDRAGHVYVGSSGGVGEVANGCVERIEAGLLNTAFIPNLFCGLDDRLCGVTKNGELFIIKNDKVETVLTQDAMLGHMPLCAAIRDGVLVAGTVDGGVVVLTAAPGSRSGYSCRYYAAGGLKTVNSLSEDSQKRLWACGDNGLGFFADNYKFTLVEGVMMNSSIETLREDYEHNFWVTSSRQGLLQIARDKFMDVNFAMSIPTGVVNTTCKFGGYLYIGTDNGLFAVDRNWRSVETPVTKLLAGVRIRDIMVDSRKNVWICTYKSNYGLVRLDPHGGLSFLTARDGLPDDSIRTVMELRDGGIAVGTKNGAAIVRDYKVAKTYTEKDGVTNTTILSLCEDADGVLYLGSDGGGIFTVRGGKVTNYTTKDGLESGVILRMLYDQRNKGIWISTGTSLSFYDFRRLRPIRFHAQVNSGIYDFKEDRQGRLMILADTGIHIADTAALLADKNPGCISYVRKDGLHSTVTANSWNCLDESGVLYLCCANGVYAINTRNAFVDNEKPLVVINRAEVDGTVYENPHQLVLPSDAKRLTLDISVLSYTNPEYNSAVYELEGFDKEPVTAYAKDLHSISYTNLSGGSYVFRILKASNCDGVQSEVPIKLSIEKEKSLREQPLFVAFAIIAAAGLIFLATHCFYRKRNRELMLRQEELREITSQSITAIANTIDAKDPYTRGHSTRVADYSVQIAKKLGMAQTDIDNLYYTALLHDIGKIGVPDHILRKPDKLTNEEYAVMKQHPTIGGEILKTITIINEIKDGAEYHHERYDGCGYNKGIKGEEIPLAARIICVADSVDAMGSTRPYRECRTQEYIISELQRCAGSQFDPKIAQAFIDLLKSGQCKLAGK